MDIAIPTTTVVLCQDKAIQVMEAIDNKDTRVVDMTLMSILNSHLNTLIIKNTQLKPPILAIEYLMLTAITLEEV